MAGNKEEEKMAQENNTSELEIMVAAGDPMKVAAANSVSNRYQNIRFTFTPALDEAEGLISKKPYNAAIICTPLSGRLGGEPSYIAPIVLGYRAATRKVPIVFADNNTENRVCGRYSSELSEARVIASSTQNIDEVRVKLGDAIDYATFLTSGLQSDQRMQAIVDTLWIRFGTPEQVRRVLDRSMEVDEVYRKESTWRVELYDGCRVDMDKLGFPSEIPPWTVEAFNLMHKEEKGLNLSLSESPDWQKKKFADAEEGFKRDYIRAREFIQKTLAKYRKPGME